MKDHDDSLSLHQNSINSIKKQIEDILSKLKENENQFTEINMKILNFDALNKIFNRSDDDEKKSYNNDELSAIVLALESKFNLKMNFIDAKFNKTEEEIKNLKSLEKELEQTNKNLEQTNKTVNFHNEQINILFAKFDDLKNYVDKLDKETNGKFNEELEKIKNYFEEKIVE